MFGKEKVAIYIDGSNFYHYLKGKEISFPKDQKFDFKLFADFIVGDRNCISKRYYTGIFRNVDNSPKSQELVVMCTHIWRFLLDNEKRRKNMGKAA